MNALATLLLAMGHRVSGSDAKASAVLDRLEGLGATVYVGHDAAHVGDADLVAYSTAVKAGNAEVEEARRRGIPTYGRPDLTGAICRSRRTLTVSGTHGKTTTTAMLAAILVEAGMRPGFMVGGELPGGRGGAEWGTGELLVVEGDESDGSFRKTAPFGVVVTNVEPDHLDFHGDMPSLRYAFERFIAEAPGPKVVSLDDPVSAGLATEMTGTDGLVTYGTATDAHYRASVTALGRASATFRAYGHDRDLGGFELAVPGVHNVRNALAALAMAMEVGADVEAARRALHGFRGVARRFEMKGTARGVTFIDDYAHNPGKVRAVMAAALDGEWGRVVAVFQPHRYSRTASLWRDFGDAFTGADVLVLTGIYAAGEDPIAGVDGRLVLQAVSEAHPGQAVQYIEGRADLAPAVAALLRPGDLCLTLGAGDLDSLAGEVMALLEPATGPDAGAPSTAATSTAATSTAATGTAATSTAATGTAATTGVAAAGAAATSQTTPAPAPAPGAPGPGEAQAEG
jgi:UDP-N-acetylmuramate--alanine ligase